MLNLNQSGNGQAVNRVTVLRRLPVNDDVCGSDGNQPKRKHRTFRFMILAIPGLVLLGAIAALEYGLHSAFADASGASAVIGVMLQLFFGLVALCLTLLASVCLGGPLSTAVREYALVFYGGRYPALGSALYPLAQPNPEPGFQGTPGLA